MNLNRKQYKDIKRMDHKQMENFVVKLYNEGYNEGKKVAKPKGSLSEIEAAIIKIKGVGRKKADEIIAAIKQLYEKEI